MKKLSRKLTKLLKSKKRKRKGKSKKEGFTLIELLVVSTIIVVLSIVGLVSFNTAGAKARDAQRIGDLEAIKNAAILYKIDNGSYPQSGDIFSAIDNGLDIASDSLMDKIANVVKVDQAHAIAIDDGFTPPPTNDDADIDLIRFTIEPTSTPWIIGTPIPTVIVEETIMPTSTPEYTRTPIPTSIPTATPTVTIQTPVPTATVEAKDEVVPRTGDSGVYNTVATGLVTAGYLEKLPEDPKNSGDFYYAYESSDGTYFSVSALLEDGTEYVLTN